MLTMSHVYYAIGVLLAGTAVLNVLDRRWPQAAFWAILSVPCLVGDQIAAATKAGTPWPAQLMGAGVIALAVLAAISRARPVVDDPEQTVAREALAKRFGNLLFVPVLAIPVIVAGIVLGARPQGSPVPRVIDPGQLALISLGVAAAIALIGALAVTRARPLHGLTEGRRLLDTIGWPVVLPLMLATLGVVFVETGVGKAIAALVDAVIPTDSALACLLAFGLGMVAFTAIMGNAFAAFPVMMAGIGLPLLVKHHGAHPAVLGAMGMLTGYCGTLVTPMAANYNIVPVLLLELRDPHGVIRAQWPTALVLLVANLILMNFLVFR
ncbi:MAG TPA: DUF979 family protein [Kofleriaceae bacterium]